MPTKSENLRAKFRNAIKRHFWTRLHMALILAATGLIGVCSSTILLWLGLSSMVMRYPLVVLTSWGAFIAIIRLWISYILRRRFRHETSKSRVYDINSDPLSILVQLSPSSANADGIEVGAACNSSYQGGGGRFAGGGASGQYGPASDNKVSVKGGLGLDIGSDEIVLLIGLIILVIGIIGSSVYLIYTAPEIISEASFEFMLAASLIKTAHRVKRGDWVGSVLQATWKPFTVIFVLATAFAILVGKIRPNATQMSEVFLTGITHNSAEKSGGANEH